MRWLAVLGATVLVHGCGFHPSGTEFDAGESDAAVDGRGDDAAITDGPLVDGPVIDGPVIDGALTDAAVDAGVDAPVVDDILHVFAADETLGTGDWVLSTDATVRTSGATFGWSATLPPGVTFAAAPQDPSGPGLAILHVRDLTITAGTDVRVLGGAPLVIIADRVTLAGAIDAGARFGTPGGGGNATGGTGAGVNGAHRGTYSDSGGGGASFGTLGARGGNAFCTQGCNPDSTVPGGAAGALYGTSLLDTLEGGSAGGRGAGPNNCTLGPVGAGGGAVQIYARTSITIATGGGINAGGGGGAGGEQCNNNWSSAHGGGSGGAIFLQSPIVTSAGVLAANGGGGGAGAGQNSAGADGANATLSTSPAAGGPSNGPFSAAGGSGAAGATNATPGADIGDAGNGGGGGGGAGRIVIRYRTSVTAGTASPTATTAAY
jgi:hypothetical protein